MLRYSASITPAMPEQMAQSRSMSPLCHAQSTKRAFTASATCRSKLVGTDEARIVSEVSALLTDPVYYRAMSEAVNPYGDGEACGRIVRLLE